MNHERSNGVDRIAGGNGRDGDDGDRYELVNLGLKIAAAGNTLVRTGRLLGEIGSDELAAQLLTVERHLSDNEKLSFSIRTFLRREARHYLGALDAAEAARPTGD